jgi:hypothetical protein
MRERQINMRLGEAEFGTLALIAARWGVSQSEAARRAILLAAGASPQRRVVLAGKREGKHMQRVIDGKKYDTETAIHICRLPSTDDMGSFDWHETDLYVSLKGQFFLAGEGHARSMWATHVRQGTTGPGNGMQLLTKEEARTHAEEAGLDADEMQAAGFDVEEG